ncbi:MAG: hypothetical protein KDI56_12870 [Xanthomonadales bacterium]|nr:hypothetical protein [Xanthomonadales bacterium]
MFAQSHSVRTIPTQLDGSNRFAVILDGFKSDFFNCGFTLIDQSLDVSIEGDELTIKRNHAPCGGVIGEPAEEPTFIPIPAFLQEEQSFPVPLRIKVEVECTPFNDPCPHGEGLPPGVIGYFAVGEDAIQSEGYLAFEPGFWQANYNGWRFFNFERQAESFIAAAGYAANDNTNGDLRWSVAAASVSPFMELVFYEPDLAACFSCLPSAPVGLRSLQDRARVWIAFDAPNFAFLSDGSGAASFLTRAPLALAPPPFGPLTGRFEVIDPSFPAAWIEFELPQNPEPGVSYSISTDLEEDALLLCDVSVSASTGQLNPYHWECRLTMAGINVAIPAGAIALDSIYKRKSDASSSVLNYEIFAQRLR